MDLNAAITNGSVSLSSFAYGFLPLFYLVPPHYTYFRTISEIPPYIQQAVPYFLVFIIIESVVLWIKSRETIPINDAIVSISGGIIEQIIHKVVLQGFEVSVYIWIYTNYSMVHLPWDSPFTWWLCFIVYDFLYYWFHRMAHEVSLVWSFHQMHHSSEQYNLTTALRQSALQKFGSWFFYMPMALGIPPTQYIVHKQFNLLYQFWIHTEVIDKLGPLEYILNTPSHHRVHHGRNRYCIDKNYGGVFIIWDRMFGTFAPEQDGSKIHYGLVHNVKTFNPIKLQLFLLVNVLRSVWRAPSLSHKLSVILKGPGWSPGTPRLGDPNGIPLVPTDIIPYDNPVPSWINVYCLFHFFVTGFLSVLLDIKKNEMAYLSSLLVVFFLFFCFTNIGLIYDISWKAPSFEIIRLVSVMASTHFFGPHMFTAVLSGKIMNFLWVTHLFSLLLWCYVLCKQIISFNKKKEQ